MVYRINTINWFVSNKKDFKYAFCSWLFNSGKLDKKFDFFHCLVDADLFPEDAEEMKPMRDNEANDRKYSSTEGGQAVAAPVVVSVLRIQVPVKRHFFKISKTICRYHNL